MSEPEQSTTVFAQQKMQKYLQLPQSWSKLIENPRTVHSMFQLLDTAIERYQTLPFGSCQVQHLQSQLIALVLKCLQEFAQVPMQQFSSLESKKMYVENFCTHLQWCLRAQTNCYLSKDSIKQDFN